jgi:hypothetical protein
MKAFQNIFAQKLKASNLVTNEEKESMRKKFEAIIKYKK